MQRLTNATQAANLVISQQGEVIHLRPRDDDGTLSSRGIQVLAEMINLLRQALSDQAATLTLEQLADQEQQFRAYIVQWFQTLSFRGMMLTPTPIVLPLADIYVHLWGASLIPQESDTLSAAQRRAMLRLAENLDREAQREVELELDVLQREQLRRTQIENRPIADFFKDAKQRAMVILGDPGSGKTTLLQLFSADLRGRANANGQTPESHWG